MTDATAKKKITEMFREQVRLQSSAMAMHREGHVSQGIVRIESTRAAELEKVLSEVFGMTDKETYAIRHEVNPVVFPA